MSDRKDHIKVLYQMLKQMEWNNGVMPIQSRIDALKFAINSLEVDEAYQLEYEKTIQKDDYCKDCSFVCTDKCYRILKPSPPTITLDELKEIRKEIRFETDRRTAMLCEEDVLAILDKRISELEGK